MLDISYMYVLWYLLNISCHGGVSTMVLVWVGTVMPVGRHVVVFGLILFCSPLIHSFALGGSYISKGLLKVSHTCDVFQDHSHSLDVVEQVLDVVFVWAYFKMQSVSLSGEGGAY
jgi:hypothetical protein